MFWHLHCILPFHIFTKLDDFCPFSEKHFRYQSLLVTYYILDPIYFHAFRQMPHLSQLPEDMPGTAGILNNAWLCPCGEVLKSQMELEHHKRLHTEKAWPCGLCRKSFASSYTLRRHKEAVHDKIRYKCHRCMKTFSDTSALVRHQKHAKKCKDGGNPLIC